MRSDGQGGSKRWFSVCFKPLALPINLRLFSPLAALRWLLTGLGLAHGVSLSHMLSGPRCEGFAGCGTGQRPNRSAGSDIGLPI